MRTFTLDDILKFTPAQKAAIEKYALVFGFFNMSLATLEELEEVQNLLEEVFKNDE